MKNIFNALFFKFVHKYKLKTYEVLKSNDIIGSKRNNHNHKKPEAIIEEIKKNIICK